MASSAPIQADVEAKAEPKDDNYKHNCHNGVPVHFTSC